MDPWRYWELGRIIDEPFAGVNLDVSSPKLLPSLLRKEQRGTWIAIDLFSDEIANWRYVDPDLDLRVDDARALSFGDASFDACLCVSVVEHIPGDGDIDALREIWRVLRPGGVLHLTTMISNAHRDKVIDHKLYGDASTEVGGGVFYSRYYDDATLQTRLLSLPWEVNAFEEIRQINPSIESTFYRLAPWSYAGGFALRWLCPTNFAKIDRTAQLADDEFGVVYLKLRKPYVPSDSPSA